MSSGSHIGILIPWNSSHLHLVKTFGNHASIIYHQAVTMHFVDILMHSVDHAHWIIFRRIIIKWIIPYSLD